MPYQARNDVEGLLQEAGSFKYGTGLMQIKVFSPNTPATRHHEHSMKVAFIRYKYDPYGGAERFSQAIIRSLAERGVEVHVFARKWMQPSTPGVVMHRVGGLAWPSLIRHASFVFLAGRAVGRYRFDLIQSNERTLCQDIYRAGDGVHARWLELRRAQLSWPGRLSIGLNPFHHYMCLLERRLFEDPRLKAVIVNSQMVRSEILSRFQISSASVHVIYNGVDLERFNPRHRAGLGKALRTEQGISEKTPVVLFVGSGFERKGLAMLMHAAAKLGGDIQLWVVGKGKTRRYERIAKELGIAGRTRFFGPRDDVVPFYAAADVFALPTLYDPFPTVVLEAMASGLPVVTTAQCGAAEIITQGKEGFVVESPAHVEDFAQYLELLCEEDMRENMSRAARERGEAFPLERTIREIEALYHGLLQVH